MKEHFQITGCTHTFIRFRYIAFMVEGQRNLEGIRLLVVECPDLFVYGAFVMAVLPVEKSADPFGHDRAHALNDIGIVAHDHTYGVGV